MYCCTGDRYHLGTNHKSSSRCTPQRNQTFTRRTRSDETLTLPPPYVRSVPSARQSFPGWTGTATENEVVQCRCAGSLRQIPGYTRIAARTGVFYIRSDRPWFCLYRNTRTKYPLRSSYSTVSQLPLGDRVHGCRYGGWRTFDRG